MAKLAFALGAAATMSVAAPTDAATAFCAASERAIFVEFPEGSAQVPDEVRDALMMQIMPQLSGGRYVDSYYVLASGDIAEGAAWEAATAQERSADRQLGQARVDAILEMIRRQPPGMRSENIETRVRDNRQVFSEAELTADPALNQRLRAGIVATIRQPAPAPVRGQPVPLC